MVDYLVERMAVARPDTIRLVTRPAKTDVAAWARRRGLEVVHAEPPDVAASLLNGMHGLADDVIVIVGFPDTVWEPADGFERLVAAVRDGADVALGLFETAEPRRCDIVEATPRGRVTGIEVKPAAPGGSTTWGCLAARKRVFAGMSAWSEPGAYLDAICSSTICVGLHLGDRYVDIGTPEARHPDTRGRRV